MTRVSVNAGSCHGHLDGTVVADVDKPGRPYRPTVKLAYKKRPFNLRYSKDMT